MDHSEDYKVNQKHYLKLAGLDKQHETGEEQIIATVLYNILYKLKTWQRNYFLIFLYIALA